MNLFSKGLGLLIMLTLNFSVYAQNGIVISGKVKDKENGNNLMYCSVAVLNMSDSLITGGITNEKGFFNIPVKPGNYKIAISYMGYVADTINAGYITNSKFLGTYKLEKDSQSLDEVEVTASSRESSIDKETQIVTDDLRKGTSDTKEVLEKIPGLSYDRYNNTISVDNSSNVIFLVEGVEKNQEYIKNLPPERLKKIEVIRNPGGRYGLEGYSAIINIILRKDYTGQELYVSDQLLIDPDQKNNSYIIPLNRFNINYTYTFNKLNVYAGVNNHLNNFAIKTYNNTIYNQGWEINEYSPDDQANMFFKDNTTHYTVGADYYINPRNTVSFESNMGNFPKATQSTDQIMKTDVIDSNQVINSFHYKTTSDKNTNDSYTSVFYSGKLSNKDRIDASLNYSYYNENYNNKTEYEDANWRYEQGENRKNFTKLNIEYTREFNDKLTTQFGYGNIWKKLDNSFEVTENTEGNDSTSIFKQTETRHNLYGYLSYNINKKLAFKTGIAAEYSNPVTETQNNKYFIYQPYFDLKYTINPNLSMKLMFRSKADYPDISQTNPFPSQIDPTTITTGNPNLKPSVINKLSLKLSYKQGLFSIEPYYHFSNNYISQTGYLRPDGIFEYTYSNIGHFEDIGVQTNFTIKFGKLFVWQNSFRVYNSKITYDNNVNKVTDWRANSQLVFIGMKKNGVLVAQYRRDMGKNINAMGYTRNNNDYWLFVYQQPFLKNHLTAMVGYFLPVNWGVTYDQSGYVKADGYEKYTHTDISILKNMFIFRLTYRFSKGKVKKLDKIIENEKESSGKGVF